MLLGVPIMAVIYYIVTKIVKYCLNYRGIPDEKVDYKSLNSIDKETNEPIYNSKNEKKKESF